MGDIVLAHKLVGIILVRNLGGINQHYMLVGIVLEHNLACIIQVSTFVILTLKGSFTDEESWIMQPKEKGLRMSSFYLRC